jgi:hypothetical protein
VVCGCSIPSARSCLRRELRDPRGRHLESQGSGSPTRAAARPLGSMEDRVHCAKDAGLTDLPLHDFARKQILSAIVALACELIAWMNSLAMGGTDARR